MKKEREKEQRFPNDKGLRLFVTNFFMVAMVFLVSAILLLMAMGYQPRLSGSWERSGMVQINSLPVGANVAVDGELLSVRTNMSRTFQAGEHLFEVSADRYDSWSKQVTVSPGILTRLTYVRLFPTQRIIEDVHDYEAVYNVRVSPGRQTMVVMKTKASWDYVDVRGVNARLTSLDITTAFTMEDIQNSIGIDIVDWSKNGALVLIRLDEADGGVQWAVLDLSKPAQVQNIEKTHLLKFTLMRFLDGDGSELAAVENSNLRTIDVARRTISAPIALNVESIYASRGVVGFVQRDEDGEHVAGLWRTGMSKPTLLGDLSLNGVTDTKIVFGEFEGKGWVAVTMGSKCQLYFGNLDRVDRIREFREGGKLELKAGVESLSVSPGGRFLMIRFAVGVEVVDMDSGRIFQEIGEVTHGTLRWLDDYMLYQNIEAGLMVMDFDGTNERTLLVDNKDVVLIAPDNRWMYFFERSEEQVKLRRWQILY